MSRKVLNGLDLSSQRIVNLADPSSATDATNKQYVDGKVNGLAWKSAVRAATTTNGTLASTYANGSSIDGVTLSTNDRILLKNQTTGSENGLYTVNASGAPTRAADADTSAEFGPNSTVYVSEGTTNADTAWTLTNNSVTLGTTSLTFAQVGGGTTYTAGNGLTLTGTTFDVGAGTGISVAADTVAIDTSVVARKFATNVGDGSSTTITVTHNLGTRDVIVELHDSSTFDEVECDVNHATTNTVTLTFASAPTSNAYRCTVLG